MKRSHSQSNLATASIRSAAEWVFRHDRGLTAAEQDEFSQWLASDPSNQAAWAECRWGWQELDRLAGLQNSIQAVPDPDLLAPRARPWLRPAAASLLAAAGISLGVLLWERPKPPREAAVPLASPLELVEERELDDGSLVKLNRGAALTEHYTSILRHVRLARGEAHFTVMPDTTRPFIVEAGGVIVRAVGTAFNVRVDATGVEVLVTQGKVRVNADRPQGAAAASGTNQGTLARDDGMVMVSGERTLILRARAAPAPQIERLSANDIEARLAWQPRMLDFTNTPLAEIVAEFNRRNPIRLELADPRLRELRLSATFRSDNVEGFVRLMIADFGMRVEHRDEGRIRLSAQPATGR